MATFDIPGDMMLTPDRTSVVLATGPARVKQRLKVGIQTILGSYKYDPSAGLPWFEWFDQGMRFPIEGELRKFFLTFPEVASINKLTLSVERSTRMLSVRYELQLKDGSEITDSTPLAQITS
jgi:hypothetical protein